MSAENLPFIEEKQIELTLRFTLDIHRKPGENSQEYDHRLEKLLEETRALHNSGLGEMVLLSIDQTLQGNITTSEFHSICTFKQESSGDDKSSWLGNFFGVNLIASENASKFFIDRQRTVKSGLEVYKKRNSITPKLEVPEVEDVLQHLWRPLVPNSKGMTDQLKLSPSASFLDNAVHAKDGGINHAKVLTNFLYQIHNLFSLVGLMVADRYGLTEDSTQANWESYEQYSIESLDNYWAAVKNFLIGGNSSLSKVDFKAKISDLESKCQGEIAPLPKISNRSLNMARFYLDDGEIPLEGVYDPRRISTELCTAYKVLTSTPTNQKVLESKLALLKKSDVEATRTTDFSKLLTTIFFNIVFISESFTNVLNATEIS